MAAYLLSSFVLTCKERAHSESGSPAASSAECSSSENAETCALRLCATSARMVCAEYTYALVYLLSSSLPFCPLTESKGDRTTRLKAQLLSLGSNCFYTVLWSHMRLCVAAKLFILAFAQFGDLFIIFWPLSTCKN